MKYIIIVGDGMADISYAELENKTPLEYAYTPHMNAVARCGRVGMVQTVPQGYEPGSDVANMSLLGYDPMLYYSGRAPIEAASMGINLAPEDTAFRCNLVHLAENRMDDYSAGHIETSDAKEIILDFQKHLNSDSVKFYPGVSYRHLVVIKNFPRGKLSCTPPHDISGQLYESYLPKGDGAEILQELSDKARTMLSSSGTNKKRIDAGKKTATDIWLWGQGGAVVFPTLQERYGLRGSVISAVDLVKGLGKLAGLKVRSVEGATGYLDTNYAGKVAAAREALAQEDFVFLHVEASDETSHEGNMEKKITAIEYLDKFVVGEVLALREQLPMRIMVLPDHATLLSTKTHASQPVPFAVCGDGVSSDSAASYSEAVAEKLSTRIFTGVSLFDAFIRGNL